MTPRRATSGLAALLLALLVAALALLTQTVAEHGISGHKNLRADDTVMVIVAPQARTIFPAPDGADDPGFAGSVPEPASARYIGTVFAPHATLFRIHPIIIPPSRGPPATTL